MRPSPLRRSRPCRAAGSWLRPRRRTGFKTRFRSGSCPRSVLNHEFSSPALLSLGRSGVRPRAHILNPVMEQNEVSQLMLDIERSMQMRKMLHDKLACQEDVDLVEEWNAIEQLDLEISRK